MKIILCLFLGFISAQAGASNQEEEPAARLLVSKQVFNKFLVESVDIVIKYTIYNIGSSAAINVQLLDSSFHPEEFDDVGGQLKVKLDRIAPGTNVSHSVVVRPKKYGMYNFTAAEVKFLPSEESSQVNVVYSSEPGEGFIVSFKEYDRKFSPHLMDWLAFAVMTLPSLGIPFLLWHSSKAKYEQLLKQKREKGKEKEGKGKEE